MPWIPHLMILDDDARVLDSLVPGLGVELVRAIGDKPGVAEALRLGEAAFPGESSPPLSIAISAHGFTSDRLADYHCRSPHQIHLHLVRERGGRFDLARKLLNEQLFAVVVSDLRFSDDAGGLRAGQLFVDEVARVHPEIQGILYSAYPAPPGFPAERFVRKGADPRDKSNSLAEVIVKAIAAYLEDPSVASFVQAIADSGLVYQSLAFGSTLAQLFDLGRLLGVEASRPKFPGRSRRPLPCLLLDGESGTGKRALTSLFHAATDRRKAPLAIASCNELTNETLLRSILFGHKRGAFTDAREERPGLIAKAGSGVLLLDDFHRLPSACSAILHSFLEDGEYTRLGEEEIRRQAEAAVVLTVETAPWAERRRSGELPLAFLARVERLLLNIPPLRDRPEDIEAQSRWLSRVVSAEVGVEIDLADDAIEGLKSQSFAESNSRELRNVIERAIYRFKRETDLLSWSHLKPFVNTEAESTSSPKAKHPTATATAVASPPSPSNEWQRRLRQLAAKILGRGTNLSACEAEEVVKILFEQTMPPLWSPTEHARVAQGGSEPIPWPVWEDLWRCFSVSKLGGPAPAEKTLGIPANTLRQWISDRESR